MGVRKMQGNIPSVEGPFPQVQVALDFLDIERAIKLGHEAVKGGAGWLEVGTPLIKSEGLDAVRKLRAEFPKAILIADMKTMDAGRIEVEAAARAGASIVVCLAAASDATITQCVEAGKSLGVRIYCDTIGLDNAAERAKEVEKLGVDFIGVHCPVDEQMQGKDPLERLREVSEAVNIPVAVAGGITSENAGAMVAAGASVVIVGGAIHKSPDASIATTNMIKAATEQKAVASSLGKRGAGGSEDIRKMLLKASSSNLSDAMHKKQGLRGLVCRTAGRGLRMAGPAVTVYTAHGDWNKVVQAIDMAKEGSVIIADCGGVPPAVWGECATLSAIQKKIAGVVIHGAIRDTDCALELGLPLFSTCISPDAGTPKGFGEINCELVISGQSIQPGDWIVGDDDGIMVLPKDKALEYANRAVDVMEAEARVKKEIRNGATLGSVINLSKWEKQ